MTYQITINQFQIVFTVLLKVINVELKLVNRNINLTNEIKLEVPEQLKIIKHIPLYMYKAYLQYSKIFQIYVLTKELLQFQSFFGHKPHLFFLTKLIVQFIGDAP
jgi:hypothetical protein